MVHSAFSSGKDIHDLSDKVIFFTGNTAGLGQGAILGFAKRHSTNIFFSGRNAKAANTIIAKVRQRSPTIPVTFINCDHTLLASIEECANAIKPLADRLNILTYNAGVMALPAGITKDGYEIQFGITT